jgi:hypothetical protein
VVFRHVCAGGNSARLADVPVFAMKTGFTLIIASKYGLRRPKQFAISNRVKVVLWAFNYLDRNGSVSRRSKIPKIKGVAHNPDSRFRVLRKPRVLAWFQLQNSRSAMVSQYTFCGYRRRLLVASCTCRVKYECCIPFCYGRCSTIDDARHSVLP